MCIVWVRCSSLFFSLFLRNAFCCSSETRILFKKSSENKQLLEYIVCFSRQIQYPISHTTEEKNQNESLKMNIDEKNTVSILNFLENLKLKKKLISLRKSCKTCSSHIKEQFTAGLNEVSKQQPVIHSHSYCRIKCSFFQCFKVNKCGCLVLIINILIRISISKQLLRTTLIVCKINSLQGPTDCIYYALEIYLLFIRLNWHWKLIFIRASLHESSRRLLNVTECCFCFCRF